MTVNEFSFLLWLCAVAVAVLIWLWVWIQHLTRRHAANGLPGLGQDPPRRWSTPPKSASYLPSSPIPAGASATVAVTAAELLTQRSSAVGWVAVFHEPPSARIRATASTIVRVTADGTALVEQPAGVPTQGVDADVALAHACRTMVQKWKPAEVVFRSPSL